MVDDKQTAAGVSSDVSKQEIEQDRVFKLRVSQTRAIGPQPKSSNLVTRS